MINHVGQEVQDFVGNLPNDVITAMQQGATRTYFEIGNEQNYHPEWANYDSIFSTAAKALQDALNANNINNYVILTEGTLQPTSYRGAGCGGYDHGDPYSGGDNVDWISYVVNNAVQNGPVLRKLSPAAICVNIAPFRYARPVG